MTQTAEQTVTPLEEAAIADYWHKTDAVRNCIEHAMPAGLKEIAAAGPAAQAAEHEIRRWLRWLDDWCGALEQLRDEITDNGLYTPSVDAVDVVTRQFAAIADATHTVQRAALTYQFGQAGPSFLPGAPRGWPSSRRMYDYPRPEPRTS